MKISELQATLPRNAHSYSEAFKASTVPHRDYAHAYLHVQKALGRLADALDSADHLDNVVAAFAAHPPGAKYLADIVICAVRMANTNPEGPIDLERAIRDRLAEKFPTRDADKRGADK